jgi:hypothetical protein
LFADLLGENPVHNSTSTSTPTSAPAATRPAPTDNDSTPR